MSRARHKRRSGAVAPMKVASNPHVLEEAEEHKRGGKVKRKPVAAVEMAGGAVRQRLDRPRRGRRLRAFADGGAAEQEATLQDFLAPVGSGARAALMIPELAWAGVRSGFRHNDPYATRKADEFRANLRDVIDPERAARLDRWFLNRLPTQPRRARGGAAAARHKREPTK